MYFELAERIREHRVDAADIAQWGMINEETLGKFPRLERLLARAVNQPRVRAGERIQFYERKDGELGLLDEWDHDENAAYLLRRLRDVAERFRPLFATDAEFEAFFPAVSARTNLQAARTAGSVATIEPLRLIDENAGKQNSRAPQRRRTGILI